MYLDPQHLSPMEEAAQQRESQTPAVQVGPVQWGNWSGAQTPAPGWAV